LDIQTISHFSEPVRVAILPNGFTLIQIEHESEFVTVNFAIAGGSVDDTVEGEAHYLEHLTTAGRHRGGEHPAVKVFKNQFGLMDDNATTSQLVTKYYGHVWRKDARAFVEILGDLVTRPELHEAAVDAERPIIRSEIVGSQDDTRSRELYLGTIFPSRRDFFHDPAGTVESINRITSDGLKNFHKRVYTKHRAALVLKGMVDLRDVAEWIAPFVEQMPDGNRQDRIRKIQYEPEEFGFRHLKDKRTQSIELEFLNGGPAAGLELLTLNIARLFFTHSKIGSLYRALRHERGLVYGMSNIIKAWPLHLSGVGTEGIDEKDVDAVTETINSIMANADLGNFNEELVAWVKRDFVMHETDAFEDSVKISKIIDIWLQDMLLDFDMKSCISAVKQVTSKDLLEIHRKYWNPERMLVIRTDPA
jgi:predicted Zn-dependent peptidase